jgi:hypothetical protein
MRNEFAINIAIMLENKGAKEITRFKTERASFDEYIRVYMRVSLWRFDVRSSSVPCCFSDSRHICVSLRGNKSPAILFSPICFSRTTSTALRNWRTASDCNHTLYRAYKHFSYDICINIIVCTIRGVSSVLASLISPGSVHLIIRIPSYAYILRGYR